MGKLSLFGVVAAGAYVLLICGMAGLVSVIIWTQPGPIDTINLLYCIFGQIVVSAFAFLLVVVPAYGIFRS